MQRLTIFNTWLNQSIVFHNGVVVAVVVTVAVVRTVRSGGLLVRAVVPAVRAVRMRVCRVRRMNGQVVVFVLVSVRAGRNHRAAHPFDVDHHIPTATAMVRGMVVPAAVTTVPAVRALATRVVGRVVWGVVLGGGGRGEGDVAWGQHTTGMHLDVL